MSRSKKLRLVRALLTEKAVATTVSVASTNSVTADGDILVVSEDQSWADREEVNARLLDLKESLGQRNRQQRGRRLRPRIYFLEAKLTL